MVPKVSAEGEKAAKKTSVDLFNNSISPNIGFSSKLPPYDDESPTSSYLLDLRDLGAIASL